MREITSYAGHSAITVDGKRDPIFDGFTASGYRREYTLSELTFAEKQSQAQKLLLERGDRTYLQVAAIVGAVSTYADLDRSIEDLTS